MKERTGKPTSYLFVLTEHPNSVQTARSFHGATPQRFLLWLNCSIQLSQKNSERLWWKILSVYSTILDRTKTTTQELQRGKG